MATKPKDAIKVYPDVDELLDHEIEARIKQSIWSREKLVYAQHVLDRRALNRAKDAQAEQTEIARSAKDAAWESAKAAKGANARATIAIVVSIVAVVLAAAGVFIAYEGLRPS